MKKMEMVIASPEQEELSELHTLADFSFSDLVDISDLQQLVNHLSELAGCPIGILDANNTILASANWQKICTCFHRIHPETKKHCSESDSYIRQHLDTKKPIVYKCKNGLWDVAYPVFLEEKHVANIFFGQFFFDDEVIDIPFFERQADKYGFNKTEYIGYLHEVPVISRKKADTLKDFIIVLAQMLTKTGYSNLLLKKEKIEELRITNQQLKESELKFRKFFEQAGVGVAQVESSTGRFIKINNKLADMLGYSIDELMHLTFQHITYPDDLKKSLHNQGLLLKKQISEFSTEKRYIRKDGKIIWVMITVSTLREINEGDESHILIVQDITERKKAEKELIESELRFRKLFELAGVGVAQVDVTTGRFVKVNTKLAHMLGYSIEEMLQLTFKQITYPSDLKESLNNQSLLLKKQIGEFSVEKRYLRKDGTVFWAVLTASSMGEIEGGDNFQIAIVQDITERKRSERELIESELRFRKLFELAGVGVAQVDASTGRLIKINKKFADMLGYSIEEMLRLTFRDITYPDDIIESSNNYSRLRKKQIGEFVIEKRYIRKDGTIFWGVLTVSPMGEIASGENTQIAIVQDITENKKAEKTLIEDNARFHTTMDAIDSVVYVADMENYEILFVNKYVKDVFGEITGKKCYSALQGKTEPCEFCTNHLLRDVDGNANPPYIWEFQNLLTKKWYQCHDQAIRWTNGNLVRFEIATDITENKENVEALKESEIKLQELNSTKDKFFSIIAHDLKNPFGVLLFASELLLTQLEGKDLTNKKDLTDVEPLAKMLHNSSKKGFELLENLLEWARSQTGKIDFSPSYLNLKSIVSKCIKIVEGHAKNKNITIINDVADDLQVMADKNLLSVVLRNLVTNAIKFTHNGGSITIKAHAKRNMAEVSVIDTGIGIPKEHQDKLFRIDANYSRVGTANEASTSLGLILCKEFIEKHNGKIWVESEENKGSAFKFTLPMLN